jgi:SAM-dependent methyltransferase
MFAEPAAAWHEWRARWEYLLRNMQTTRQRSVDALESADTELLDTTRNRLSRRIEAEAAHIETLKELLAPLETEIPENDIAMFLALRTRLPPDQGLLTYYSNVHRDWVWGDAENNASAELVINTIGDHAPKRMLVLGSGAGRLTYDLHQHYKPQFTAGLDFNPLLSLIAARVTSGETVNLREFPIAPRSVDDYGAEHALSCPAASAGLHWIIGDTHRPPFPAQSFDTIVTPWLIDIVPEQLEAFVVRINNLLSDGGLWINFGSLSFMNVHPAQQYTPQECQELMAATGFDPGSVEQRRIEYLSSPSSRHGRTEEVLAWAAKKLHHEKKVPKYEALPEWLVRGNAPVPLDQGVQTQATSAQVHGFLLSLIDGKRSLKDMAKIAVERRLLEPQEAEATIRNFLIKMVDESRRLGYQ